MISGPWSWANMGLGNATPNGELLLALCSEFELMKDEEG